MPSIPQQISIMKHINTTADTIECPDCGQSVVTDSIEMTIAFRENEFCNLFIHYYCHCPDCENYANVVEEFAVSRYQKLVIEDYDIKSLRTEEWVNNVQS